ncbi:MAG TPA: DUF2934 domain-containing protein [Beijerinckiaceae bacterium]|jgi:hypothetical protein
MDRQQEERVRRRAYELWEQDGRAGDPEDHWLRAERELKDLAQETGGIAAEAVLPDDAIAAADSGIR